MKKKVMVTNFMITVAGTTNIWNNNGHIEFYPIIFPQPKFIPEIIKRLKGAFVGGN